MSLNVDILKYMDMSVSYYRERDEDKEEANLFVFMENFPDNKEEHWYYHY